MEKTLNSIKQKMEDSIEHMKLEFSKIRGTNVTPTVLNGIMVEAYDDQLEVSSLAAISKSNGRQLLIHPHDKSLVKNIMIAITQQSDFHPIDEGERIRITFAPLTEETRQKIVKMTKIIVEDAKISIRNARHEFINDLKKDESISKNERDEYLEKIQKLIDEYNKKVEDLFKEKEKILTTI